ncbi:hypothetical protein E2C01_013459 [Portunus trituberculatus]|uniref:Uncharacterized protein n=1 Tax=Portunus trituberculatus TaxID=210409 RepID=A0A5B7DGA0_PORTR|nr:hypothetical protein [Portunus trituberculatus]
MRKSCFLYPMCTNAEAKRRSARGQDSPFGLALSAKEHLDVVLLHLRVPLPEVTDPVFDEAPQQVVTHGPVDDDGGEKGGDGAFDLSHLPHKTIHDHVHHNLSEAEIPTRFLQLFPKRLCTVSLSL